LNTIQVAIKNHLFKDRILMS